MPVSYKRKNSMKKSKSSKGSKSSKLSKRVKTRKSTKTKKRLTRKSKNGSVVRKMRGGEYEEVKLLLNEIFKDSWDKETKVTKIINTIKATDAPVLTNLNLFWQYFTDKNFDREKLKNINYIDLIDIKEYYENHIHKK